MVKVRLAVAPLLLVGVASAAPPAEKSPSAPGAAPAAATAAASAPASAAAFPAAASTTPAPSAAAPLLHHAPVSFALASKPVRVRVSIEHPELVRRALLVYRAAGAEPVELEFERAPEGPYAAVVPAEAVRPPGVDYAIEWEGLGGERVAAFATRSSMHAIQVATERIDLREQAELARGGGRRSRISASADYVSFGTSQADLRDSTGAVTPVDVSDAYYRIEAGFTYRLLRVVSEFGIKGGVVRGSSPVPGTHDSLKDFNVGLNYGSPWARFRVIDLVHLDAQLLTSLTEEGFSGGGGGAVHVGDIYGSQLQLGFESIAVFGTRIYSRVDVATRSPFVLSATVEATNMPHADRYGVRLLGEVGIDFGKGFRGAVRGGYQARDSASGGPALGLGVGYGF